MQTLSDIDLRTDPAAARYIKEEVVQVTFAAEPGELVSREGPNRYQPGDAIVTGATGDRWVVSRDRFDARYLPRGRRWLAQPAGAGAGEGDDGAVRHRALGRGRRADRQGRRLADAIRARRLWHHRARALPGGVPPDGGPADLVAAGQLHELERGAGHAHHGAGRVTRLAFAKAILARRAGCSATRRSVRRARRPGSAWTCRW